MTQVNPATETLVTDALTSFQTWFGLYGPRAPETFVRNLAMGWFLIATEDVRSNPATVFNPATAYTKVSKTGVDRAVARLRAFLNDPANGITYLRGKGALTDGSAWDLPTASEAAARVMIVECVDMMLLEVATGDDQYAQIWNIAKGSYTFTWTDTDDDGIRDSLEAPMNVTAPTTTIASRTITVNSNGTWTGSPSSYSYVWYDDTDVIAGANTNSYVVPNLSSGDFRCVVTAINAYGSSEGVSTNVRTLAAV